MRRGLLERRFWVYRAPDKEGSVDREGSEGSFTTVRLSYIIMTKGNDG